MAEVEEKIPTIAEDIVVTKYKMAADIVNRKSIQNIRFICFLSAYVERLGLFFFGMMKKMLPWSVIIALW